MTFFEKRLHFVAAISALSVCVGLGTLARAEDKTSAPACILNHFGDCCSVIIDGNHKATVSLDVISGAQVDYTLIMNKGQSDCVFEYDGLMKVPMQSYTDSFIGTWLGGDFTLSYQNDAAGKGSCPLDVYHMAIGYAFPDACVDGHFEVLREHVPEPSTISKDSETLQTSPK